MNLIESIFRTGLLLSWIILLVINNAEYAGVSLFWLLFTQIIILTIFIKATLRLKLLNLWKNIGAVGYAHIIIVVGIMIFNMLFSGDEYYFGGQYVIGIIILILFFAPDFSNSNRFNDIVTIICLTIFAIIFAKIIYSSDSSRVSVLFGPNIFYRLMCILALAAALPYMKAAGSIILRVSSFSLLFTYASFAIATGSRGALLSVIFLYFTVFVFRFGVKAFYFFIVILMIFAFVYYAVIDETYIRVLSFDPEGDAIANRIDAWTGVGVWAREAGVELLYGTANVREFTHIMPHNFFLEMVIYFGMLFGIYNFVIIIASFYQVARIWSKTKAIPSSLLLYSVIVFIGAQVSGVLYDNYPLFIIPLLAQAYIKKFL
jgi:hypothetical protein